MMINDGLSGMEESVNGIEAVAKAMKNDDGWRIAFVYIGTDINPEKEMDWIEKRAREKEIGAKINAYDDRMWAMVDQDNGKGASPVVIDTCLPSVEFARAHGYDEKEFKPVGKVNIYSDKLGYYSPLNVFGKPSLDEKTLQEAIDEWYLRSFADDKNIIVAAKQNAEKSAVKARQDFNFRKYGR